MDILTLKEKPGVSMLVCNNSFLLTCFEILIIGDIYIEIRRRLSWLAFKLKLYVL